MENIEKKIKNLRYNTSKIDVSLSLYVYYIHKDNFKKAEDIFKKFLLFIADEPIPITRSKRLHESITFLLKFSHIQRIRTKVPILIKQIENPFFKLDAKLEQLNQTSKNEEESSLKQNVDIIDKELENSFNINFLLALFTILNPKNKKNSLISFIDQNSIDTLFKKFLTYISKIAVEKKLENLFNIALKRFDLIQLKIYKDETLRDVFNNYYLFLNKMRGIKSASQIYNLSKKIKNKSYWAETLYNYSICLRFNDNVKEIIDILENLTSTIKDLGGEFSRAVVIKESLKIIQNLNVDSKITEYIQKFEMLSNDYQGHYSSLLIKIQLVQTLYNLNKYEKSKNILKELIKYSFLIIEDNLIVNICQKIIKLFPKLEKIIEIDLIDYFISKIIELKNPLLKAHLLLILAENIKNNNESILKIKQILEKINEPYLSHNIMYFDHLYPISRFLMMHAFDMNDQELINKPNLIFKNLYSKKNECKLILEMIKQLKLTNHTELLSNYLSKFYEELDKITNEFQKKEVIVEFIEIMK
ncbi:MAG: hypothetical protein EAX96_12285 [Candidatus Lokiarchaeota archaeon]|nr:hypothetical protein [Candidatus Lokiarchaeota archaeon]